MRDDVVEGKRDRLVLARDAGLGPFSLGSTIAGTMVAYGTFIILSALVAGIAARVATSGSTSLSSNDWTKIGSGAALVLAAILAISYVFGGYVAGRMARRAGLLHGFMVFLFGVIVVAVVAAVVGSQTNGGEVARNLRNVGLPTSGHEWAKLATIPGICSLLAMLIGGLLGGSLGERWHGKLLARAADPDVGPEAEARRGAAAAAARRDRYARPVRDRDGEDRDVDIRDRDRNRDRVDDADDDRTRRPGFFDRLRGRDRVHH